VGRYLGVMPILFIILIAGCKSPTEVDSAELAEYDVSQIRDETVQDDFLFRLVSEKEEYKQGEEVKVYGEIEYIGNQDEVTINHSSSAVLFTVEEKIRGYTIPDLVQDIGVKTKLNKSKLYRKRYEKNVGFYSEHDPEDYVSFLEDFWERDDFPAGYYVVNGVADFAHGSERFEIEAEIDFKVVDE